ncbi:MAG: ParB/RepB/Spo0J family partition protein [Methylobacter sp.]|nr:ParB/RepB/Spo0J family partition protein [Methylobacter sp.]MDP2428068.1 ParB/RepB/Spo0J family partition protein [Methylobacter sp.]MDP3055295.1 ParB/RepB/Spo0J family partition protein [Methylobacter sp.]MDP3363996.1 ParB/RepB/Spo0J family partition protein [Methylobacter sp.]MDZ4219001.1 ParB/RepB/Spo0J family partition protein [Methylobacter sp.]
MANKADTPSMGELKLRMLAQENTGSQKEGSVQPQSNVKSATNKVLNIQNGRMDIDINLIDPNPYQPRKEFDDDALKALSESISICGVIQPIIVRVSRRGRYELIAGERRLRACKLLEKNKISAVIHEVDDLLMSIMALAENLDRTDLSDFETGISLASIQDHFKNKTELAEYFKRTKKDIDRLLAFNSFPKWLKDELNDKPRLISKTISQQLKTYLESSDYDDEKHRVYVIKALKSMEEGALTQALLVDNVKRQIRDEANKKVSTENNVKRSYKYDGKNIGSFTYDARNLSIKLNSSLINNNLADEIFELINNKLKKELKNI